MTVASHNLPGRIAAVMIGTLLVFILASSIFVTWMVSALDRQGHEAALTQMQNATGNLLSQIRVLTLDYAKWEAAVPMIQAENMSWIYDNIGASAVSGFSFQLVVLWGGPFAGDIGWRDNEADLEARTGLVDPALLGQVEVHLRRIPLNFYEGTEFFAWHDGSLYVIAASRFEPDSRDAVANLVSRDVNTPRILMGKRLTSGEIGQIGQTYLIDDLHVAREAPKDQQSLPFLGADGQPVAYLAWTPVHASTNLLYRMALPFVLVMALITSLSWFGIVLVQRNARQLVIAKHRASSAALTDALTGLPNRAAFNEVLAVPVLAGERAILFLDVNGFKRINDSIGHAAGDEVIIVVAKRLSGVASEDCLLARIGGDEFVFVLTGSNAGFRVPWIAHAVERTLTRPFHVQGHEMQIRMAMGYAVQNEDAMSGEDLVRQADLAMYEAKRQKTGGAVAFSAVIEDASRDASVIEQGLRSAMTRSGELSIAYQPIVDTDGRMVRAEALARWTSPELGSVAPDRFIAVAEQAGLIVDLGRKLLDIICDDLHAHPDLEVSLNVSPLQLMAPDFIAMLLRKLHERQIDSARVEIELTESIVVEDKELAAQRLEELREAGFSTALDDFGTGYSSIGYLQQLRFHVLKIDRSFVADVGARSERVALLNSMILMAHAMGLRVVCEGVETTDDFNQLRALGCDLFQGFHLDRPLTIGDLSKRWLIASPPPLEHEVASQWSRHVRGRSAS